MSAEMAIASSAVLRNPQALRVVRYALGSTLAMGIAMGLDWQLSFLLPVLTLSFLATPDPCPSLRQGLSFVAVVAVAALSGLLLANWLLPFPMVYVPFVGLLLFRIFYAKTGGRSPLLTMWLLIALLAIPLVKMLSPEVANFVAIGIVGAAAITVVLVWVIYLFLPDPVAQGAAMAPSTASAAPSLPANAERFRSAAETTVVVLPVFVLFYVLQLTQSLLILIFIAMLSSQPGFAKNFKAGGALILGNVIGGIAAIVTYELLVLMPVFGFLLLLTLASGLLFGSQLFSGKKMSPLYGMAFSTLLLIVGSTTSGNAEAGAKVYTRVIQIMVAVTYVVVAFGLMERLRRRERI